MKRWTLITSALVLLTFVAWHLFYESNLRGQPSVRAQAKPTSNAGPSTFEDFKAWLFADQSLEEITNQVKTSSPAAVDNPWSLFASALASSRQGKGEGAKKALRQVFAIPQVESRIRLLAWKALRGLEEQPPANLANEVQGVVCELHNEAGVGTIAAYSDGRARWLGGQGKVIVWEAPGSDPELSTLIKDLLKSAEPLVKTTPVFDRHKSLEPKLNYYRVSILTYSGIHITEVYGPDINEKHAIAPVFIGSVNLLDALSKK